jgi:TIR domain
VSPHPNDEELTVAEVFINYRTGDGEDAAALVELFITRRFGEDHAFKASRSIPPGAMYPQALLENVRNCLVLLAIMGPDWSSAPRLHDEDDWVRREITEARKSGVRVIPVLNGRKTDRLEPADLPGDLAWLADVQSLRLDTKSQTDLDNIGNALADLVPSLKAADRSAADEAPAGSGVANSASGVPGPLAQTGPVTGNLNFFSETHGTVHTGTGDIYPHPRPSPEENDQ